MLLNDLNTDLQAQLGEFDIWITPSLGEISDTDKYKEELALVVSAFETIGAGTNRFESVDRCKPEAIASTLAEILSDRRPEERESILQALASTLFAVTGKSDNNFKCQFPLYLRDQAQWRELPKARRRRGTIDIVHSPIPRILRSDTYMSSIAQIDDPVIEAKLLREFISFLLRDENSINQFWSIGYSYFALKEFGKSSHLLAPIVIFKVRGSVMASGGHEPENMLRSIMQDWGLRKGVDFNNTDVIVVEKNKIKDDAKTRAYDFVLPFKTRGWAEEWSNRIFIQCQFYAGDSGSVSHKNVDQTKSSRDYICGFVEDPCFVEYVDGAGYFSSLNGDLKRLLAYADTNGFFQIRSASIRLRKMLQDLGFLTPLEIEHCIALGNDSIEDIKSRLMEDGYSKAEINRCIYTSEEMGLIQNLDGQMRMVKERRQIVRRYLLLDLIALNSKSLSRDELAGKILVPGYGAFNGMPIDKLAEIAIEASPVLADDFSHSPTFLSDVRWLVENGYAMAR